MVISDNMDAHAHAHAGRLEPGVNRFITITNERDVVYGNQLPAADL